jgi:hypothetical protein
LCSADAAAAPIARTTLESDNSISSRETNMNGSSHRGNTTRAMAAARGTPRPPSTNDRARAGGFSTNDRQKAGFDVP